MRAVAPFLHLNPPSHASCRHLRTHVVSPLSPNARACSNHGIHTNECTLTHTHTHLCPFILLSHVSLCFSASLSLRLLVSAAPAPVLSVAQSEGGPLWALPSFFPFHVESAAGSASKAALQAQFVNLKGAAPAAEEGDGEDDVPPPRKGVWLRMHSPIRGVANVDFLANVAYLVLPLVKGATSALGLLSVPSPSPSLIDSSKGDKKGAVERAKELKKLIEPSQTILTAEVHLLAPNFVLPRNLSQPSAGAVEFCGGALDLTTAGSDQHALRVLLTSGGTQLALVGGVEAGPAGRLNLFPDSPGVRVELVLRQPVDPTLPLGAPGGPPLEQDATWAKQELRVELLPVHALVSPATVAALLQLAGQLRAPPNTRISAAVVEAPPAASVDTAAAASSLATTAATSEDGAAGADGQDGMEEGQKLAPVTAEDTMPPLYVSVATNPIRITVPVGVGAQQSAGAELCFAAVNVTLSSPEVGTRRVHISSFGTQATLLRSTGCVELFQQTPGLEFTLVQRQEGATPPANASPDNTCALMEVRAKLSDTELSLTAADVHDLVAIGATFQAALAANAAPKKAQAPSTSESSSSKTSKLTSLAQRAAPVAVEGSLPPLYVCFETGQFSAHLPPDGLNQMSCGADICLGSLGVTVFTTVPTERRVTVLTTGTQVKLIRSRVPDVQLFQVPPDAKVTVVQELSTPHPGLGSLLDSPKAKLRAYVTLSDVRFALTLADVAGLLSLQRFTAPPGAAAGVRSPSQLEDVGEVIVMDTKGKPDDALTAAATDASGASTTPDVSTTPAATAAAVAEEALYCAFHVQVKTGSIAFDLCSRRGEAGVDEASLLLRAQLSFLHFRATGLSHGRGLAVRARSSALVRSPVSSGVALDSRVLFGLVATRLKGGRGAQGGNQPPSPYGLPFGEEEGKMVSLLSQDMNTHQLLGGHLVEQLTTGLSSGSMRAEDSLPSTSTITEESFTTMVSAAMPCLYFNVLYGPLAKPTSRFPVVEPFGALLRASMCESAVAPSLNFLEGRVEEEGDRVVDLRLLPLCPVDVNLSAPSMKSMFQAVRNLQTSVGLVLAQVPSPPPAVAPLPTTVAVAVRGEEKNQGCWGPILAVKRSRFCLTLVNQLSFCVSSVLSVNSGSGMGAAKKPDAFESTQAVRFLLQDVVLSAETVTATAVLAAEGATVVVRPKAASAPISRFFNANVTSVRLQLPVAPTGTPFSDAVIVDTPASTQPPSSVARTRKNFRKLLVSNSLRGGALSGESKAEAAPVAREDDAKPTAAFPAPSAVLMDAAPVETKVSAAEPSIAATQTFRYLKLKITRTRNSGNGAVQLSGVKFRGLIPGEDESEVVEASTVSNPGGRNPPHCGPDRLLENGEDATWVDLNMRSKHSESALVFDLGSSLWIKEYTLVSGEHIAVFRAAIAVAFAVVVDVASHFISALQQRTALHETLCRGNCTEAATTRSGKRCIHTCPLMHQRRAMQTTRRVIQRHMRPGPKHHQKRRLPFCCVGTQRPKGKQFFC